MSVEEYCSICGGVQWNQIDTLCACSVCGIIVHAACYGITNPKEEFICQVCLHGNNVKAPPTCAVCTRSGGAMKPSDDGGFAHVVCANWLGALSINFETGIIQGVGALSLPSNQKCAHCDEVGASLRCYNGKCPLVYHPSCVLNAYFAREIYAGPIKGPGGWILRVVCSKHAKQHRDGYITAFHEMGDRFSHYHQSLRSFEFHAMENSEQGADISMSPEVTEANAGDISDVDSAPSDNDGEDDDEIGTEGGSDEDGEDDAIGGLKAVGKLWRNLSYEPSSVRGSVWNENAAQLAFDRPQTLNEDGKVDQAWVYSIQSKFWKHLVDPFFSPISTAHANYLMMLIERTASDTSIRTFDAEGKELDGAIEKSNMDISGFPTLNVPGSRFITLEDFGQKSDISGFALKGSTYLTPETITIQQLESDLVATTAPKAKGPPEYYSNNLGIRLDSDGKPYFEQDEDKIVICVHHGTAAAHIEFSKSKLREFMQSSASPTDHGSVGQGSVPEQSAGSVGVEQEKGNSIRIKGWRVLSDQSFFAVAKQQSTAAGKAAKPVEDNLRDGDHVFEISSMISPYAGSESLDELGPELVRTQSALVRARAETALRAARLAARIQATGAARGHLARVGLQFDEPLLRQLLGRARVSKDAVLAAVAGSGALPAVSTASYGSDWRDVDHDGLHKGDMPVNGFSPAFSNNNISNGISSSVSSPPGGKGSRERRNLSLSRPFSAGNNTGGNGGSPGEVVNYSSLLTLQLGPNAPHGAEALPWQYPVVHPHLDPTTAYLGRDKEAVLGSAAPRILHTTTVSPPHVLTDALRRAAQEAAAWKRLSTHLVRGLCDRDTHKPRTTRPPDSWQVSVDGRSVNDDFLGPTECAVCNDALSSPEEDVGLSCERCSLMVHAGCYGRPDDPSQVIDGVPFLCDICVLIEHRARKVASGCGFPAVPPPVCAVCTRAGGALKRALCGRWVHVFCALTTPGVIVGNIRAMALISLPSMPGYVASLKKHSSSTKAASNSEIIKETKLELSLPGSSALPHLLQRRFADLVEAASLLSGPAGVAVPAHALGSLLTEAAVVSETSIDVLAQLRHKFHHNYFRSVSALMLTRSVPELLLEEDPFVPVDAFAFADADSVNTKLRDNQGNYIGPVEYSTTHIQQSHHVPYGRELHERLGTRFTCRRFPVSPPGALQDDSTLSSSNSKHYYFEANQAANFSSSLNEVPQLCIICRSADGILVPCSAKGCNHRFHTMCAWMEGLEVSVTVPGTLADMDYVDAVCNRRPSEVTCADVPVNSTARACHCDDSNHYNSNNEKKKEKNPIRLRKQLLKDDSTYQYYGGGAGLRFTLLCPSHERPQRCPVLQRKLRACVATLPEPEPVPDADYSSWLQANLPSVSKGDTLISAGAGSSGGTAAAKTPVPAVVPVAPAAVIARARAQPSQPSTLPSPPIVDLSQTPPRPKGRQSTGTRAHLPAAPAVPSQAPHSTLHASSSAAGALVTNEKQTLSLMRKTRPSLSEPIGQLLLSLPPPPAPSERVFSSGNPSHIRIKVPKHLVPHFKLLRCLGGPGFEPRRRAGYEYVPIDVVPAPAYTPDVSTANVIETLPRRRRQSETSNSATSSYSNPSGSPASAHAHPHAANSPTGSENAPSSGIISWSNGTHLELPSLPSVASPLGSALSLAAPLNQMVGSAVGAGAEAHIHDGFPRVFSPNSAQVGDKRPREKNQSSLSSASSATDTSLKVSPLPVIALSGSQAMKQGTLDSFVKKQSNPNHFTSPDS